MTTNKVLVEMDVPENANLSISAMYQTPFGWRNADFRIIESPPAAQGDDTTTTVPYTPTPWMIACGESAQIQPADVIKIYQRMIAAAPLPTAQPAPIADSEPVAWAVYWGIGEMRKNSVHLERATAVEVASTIKSNTEIRPLGIISQPVASALPPAELTWIFTHCRAIGMNKKSESGKWEHDIALFTMDLQEEIKSLRKQLAEQPVAMVEPMAALIQIRHATSPDHEDGAYHENAYSIADAAIKKFHECAPVSAALPGGSPITICAECGKHAQPLPAPTQQEAVVP